MPTLLYRDFELVKGVGFDSWRRIGSLMQAIRVYNMREVDELVFLDITATQEERRPDFELVDDFADECFMPLTVGGGIIDVEDVQRLLEVGADKVSINSQAIYSPKLVEAVAIGFGSQCVVVSIDFKRATNGEYEVYTHSGKNPAGIDPLSFAKRAEEMGAGEILLTSIDRDGTMEGYDVECIRGISAAMSIPVIASGGAGNYQHMHEVLVDGKASAVAAASIFHFTEQTPLEAKKYLHARGIPVRL
jgi:cyclase